MSAPPRRLLHVFPSFAAGGAQMRMAALANHFGARFSHAIVALDGDTSCRDRLDPALDVTFPGVTVPNAVLPVRLWAIGTVLRRIRADLLLTSNWGAIEWAIANRVSVNARHIHTEDGFGRDERDRQLPRRVLTRRLMLRWSDIVVPSQTLLDVARDIWRLPERCVHYIPNGIDLGRFAPGPRSGGDRVTVGCVAALRPEKNISRLLRACAIAARTHRFDLVIAGDGPDRAMLEALARELGLAATFRGTVADPAPVYRDFDVFALSSDTEQMPLSVMEAMASGLPVVATDVGDIARMVAPENAALLTARDDRALSDAMCRLIDNPGLARAIGVENRRKAAADFDFAAMAAQWSRLLGG